MKNWKLLFLMLMLFQTISCSRYELNYESIEVIESTPFSVNGYKPQGLVKYSDTSFLLSIHHDDKLSTVHLINRESFEEISSFQMPPEATHTSGLTILNNLLYAVDYNSNILYEIDLNKSLKEQNASVINQYETGLKGTSACTAFNYKNENYIVISDFMNSCKTYILSLELLKSSGNFENSVKAFYKNGKFSQGLAYSDGIIYETRNAIFGKSIIELRKVEDIFKGVNNSKKARTDISGIEDLDFIGDLMLTTDEKNYTYHFFKLKLNE